MAETDTEYETPGATQSRGPAGETIISDDPDLTPPPGSTPAPADSGANELVEEEAPSEGAIEDQVRVERAAPPPAPAPTPTVAELADPTVDAAIEDLDRGALSKLRAAVDRALGKGTATEPPAELHRILSTMHRLPEASEKWGPEEAAAALSKAGIAVLPENIHDIAIRSRLDFRKQPRGQIYLRVATTDGHKHACPIDSPEPPAAEAA